MQIKNMEYFKIKIFMDEAKCSFLTALSYLSDNNYNLSKAFKKFIKDVENPSYDRQISETNLELLQDFLENSNQAIPEIRNCTSLWSLDDGFSELSPNPMIVFKRKVLIDGSNVAISYSKFLHGKELTRNDPKNFSVEGLKKCIEFFTKRCFMVKAVVPKYRLTKEKSSNHELMTKLNDEGFIVESPSRSHDDLMLLKSALLLDSAVVSNDKFRDLRGKGYDMIINKRLIKFSVVFGEFVLADDPYGTDGPKLEEILNME